MFARGFKSWCENVALQQRRDLRVSRTDRLDPIALAKHLGVTVWSVDDVPGVDPSAIVVLKERDPTSWSAISLQVEDHHVVVLNSTHSAARTASNLMHELSHIILEHKPGRVDVSGNGLLLSTYVKQQEDEANWLAGCLLLPRDVLFHIRQRRLTSEDAQREYGVSQDMLQFRLRVTGVDRQLERAFKRKT